MSFSNYDNAIDSYSNQLNTVDELKAAHKEMQQAMGEGLLGISPAAIALSRGLAGMKNQSSMYNDLIDKLDLDPETKESVRELGSKLFGYKQRDPAEKADEGDAGDGGDVSDAVAAGRNISDEQTYQNPLFNPNAYDEAADAGDVGDVGDAGEAFPSGAWDQLRDSWARGGSGDGTEGAMELRDIQPSFEEGTSTTLNDSQLTGLARYANDTTRVNDLSDLPEGMADSLQNAVGQQQEAASQALTQQAEQMNPTDLFSGTSRGMQAQVDQLRDSLRPRANDGEDLDEGDIGGDAAEDIGTTAADVAPEIGEAAGAAGLEAAGAGLDASVIGAPLGVALGLAGLGMGLKDVFDPDSESVPDSAHPTLENPV